MGSVFVKATLKGRRARKVRFLVDTGATFGLVDPDLARRVGMRLTGFKDRVRLANGKTVRVPTSVALLRVDGRETVAMFWIDPCDEPLIGVETLESLGLAVDPIKERLIPKRAYATRLRGFSRP